MNESRVGAVPRCAGLGCVERTGVRKWNGQESVSAVTQAKACGYLKKPVNPI
jgi:hypothetical protein